MFSDLFALDEIYDAPSDAEMDSKCSETAEYCSAELSRY